MSEYEIPDYGPYTYYISVGALLDTNAAVAKVAYEGVKSRGIVEATGSSRRARGDKNLPDVGEDLAVARALRNLADKLESRAYKKNDKINPDTDTIDSTRYLGLAKKFAELARPLDRDLAFHKKPPYDPPVDA